MARARTRDGKFSLAAEAAELRRLPPSSESARAAARRTRRVWKLLSGAEDLAQVGEVVEALAPLAPYAGPLERLLPIAARWPASLREAVLDALVKGRGEWPRTRDQDELARILRAVREAARERTVELLAALLAGEPGPEWGATVRRLLEELGGEASKKVASALLEPARGEVATLLAERVTIAAGALASSPETLRSLATTVERDARSGPHPRIALAIVQALSLAPPERSFPELERLRTRVRHRTVRKAIERALDAIAAASGTSREALEDASVPSCGLDGSGSRTIGDWTVRLEVSGRVSVSGPRKKAPPDVRAAARAVEDALRVQRARLEEALVTGRPLPAARWLEHPILGNLARRLVWLVAGKAAFIEGVTGEARLAHPLHLGKADLEATRACLVERSIVQPLKQLFRETYEPTDVEAPAKECDRFAGELVPQRQLFALTHGRGWRGFACMGAGTWEGSRTFGDVAAHLEVDHRSGGWDDPSREVRLGALTFRRGERVLRLREVPPIIFSEACRDLDLVVGVASVGEDAAWLAWEAARREGAERFDADRVLRYERALATTALARAALLERILPSLGLGERLAIEGKFARVRGELHTYRVHLGTANVHAEPSGRFIAFPPATEAPGVYLPEEASQDPRTAEVVRRILVLASDALVGDEGLAAQLEEA